MKPSEIFGDISPLMFDLLDKFVFENKESKMPRIPIIAAQKKPSVPVAKQLSTEQPRYRTTGKPALPLTSSFSPQAHKQREN